MSIIPVSVALAKIDAGLKAIYQRVNRQLLVAALSLAVGALFILIAAVIWVALRGSLEAFEWVAYAAIALVLLTAVLTSGRLWRRWGSVRGAARLADQRASMKELLTTALWLKETGREPGFASVLLGEAVDREAEWEARKIAPRHMPKGLWLLLIGLAALASTAFLIRSGSSASLGPDPERMVRAVAPAQKQQRIASAQQSIQEFARSMASAPDVQLAAARGPGDGDHRFDQPGDQAQPSSREAGIDQHGGTDQQEAGDGEIENQPERPGEVPEIPTVYDPLGIQPRVRTSEKEGPNAPEFQLPTEGDRKPPPQADGSGGDEGEDPEDQQGTKESDGQGETVPEDVSQPAPSGPDSKSAASSAAGAASGQGEGIGVPAAGQAAEEGEPGSGGATGDGARGRGRADAAIDGEGGGGELREIPGGGGSKAGTESSPETLLSGTGELDATSARTFRLTLDSFLDKTQPTVRGSQIEVTQGPSDNPNLALNPEQVADDALRRGDIPPGYEDIVRRIYSALAEP